MIKKDNYSCPKPGLEFQRHMSWSFLMFYELRGDVIIRLLILVELLSIAV
jgi:hypothetical protein